MGPLAMEHPTDEISSCPSYSQIHVEHDESHHIDWCYLQGDLRPCFTAPMLDELEQYGNNLSLQTERDVRYMVQASKIPGIFSYGGDLHAFRILIEKQDKATLLSYARACINVLYGRVVHFNRGITSIALVQGDALGGGLEYALACDVVIAERHVKMGLPEILFNLFPGMGAYSFLSRKIGPAKAERFILSGNLYSGEEMHEMGIVDILADEGEGERAVYDYIRRENKFRNCYQSIREVKKFVNPIPYEELLHISEIWVDAALKLEGRDLRMMDRLVSRQTQKQMTQVGQVA
ncbi:MAG: crotonase/enoyl-CoA hydratase family protein [Leptospirales bacterium]